MTLAEQEQIVREGLEAYMRVQKSISTAHHLLPTLEVPTDNLWQMKIQRTNHNVVEAHLVNASFTMLDLRVALLKLEKALQGMWAAYEEMYQNMPTVYGRGENDALRRHYKGLDNASREALRTAAIVLAAMSQPDRAVLCRRLNAVLAQIE